MQLVQQYHSEHAKAVKVQELTVTVERLQAQRLESERRADSREAEVQSLQQQVQQPAPCA